MISGHMLQYILSVVLFGSVFAAIEGASPVTGGGLISSHERFIKVGEGKWQNTSITLHSSQFFSDINLLVNLLALYDEAFDEFVDVVGAHNAIASLELDTRSTDILYSYFNVSVTEYHQDTQTQTTRTQLSQTIGQQTFSRLLRAWRTGPCG